MRLIFDEESQLKNEWEDKLRCEMCIRDRFVPVVNFSKKYFDKRTQFIAGMSMCAVSYTHLDVYKRQGCEISP